MIPRIIHYCWFGDKKMPQSVRRCIKSWRKICKGYEIILWNEDNFSIDDAPDFVKNAYSLKKWAFVTDYVRLVVVKKYGGIYLDTDVEILKSWDSLLNHKAFFGVESSGVVATGLGFGAEANSEIIDKLLDDYKTLSLDDNDEYLLTIACPELNKHIFDEYGFLSPDSIQIINGIAVYPERFFCPIDSNCTKNLRCKDTYSIHHYSATWLSKDYRRRTHRIRIRNICFRLINIIIHIPNIVLKLIIGNDRYKKLKQRFEK